MTLRAPERLTDAHGLDAFKSGEEDLDRWLRERARRSDREGASRVYVLCDGDEVVGYYALAAGAVTHGVATGKVRRNMPDPVPVVVLGRLAIASSHQGKGLGRALFRDAALRIYQAADEIGIRAVLVHALTERAKQFYLGLGLIESGIEPLTLMVTVADLRKAIEG